MGSINGLLAALLLHSLSPFATVAGLIITGLIYSSARNHGRQHLLTLVDSEYGIFNRKSTGPGHPSWDRILEIEARQDFTGEYGLGLPHEVFTEYKTLCDRINYHQLKNLPITKQRMI